MLKKYELNRASQKLSIMYVKILAKMKHFINLQDIPAKDLRKILIDAKKRKDS